MCYVDGFIHARFGDAYGDLIGAATEWGTRQEAVRDCRLEFVSKMRRNRRGSRGWGFALELRTARLRLVIERLAR